MDLLKAASSANLAAARALQQRVWVQVKDEDTWVLASVTGRFGGSVHLQRAHAPAGVDEILVVDEEDFATYAPVSETVDELVDDLAQLEEVNEAVILHTLRARYESDVIYTAIGPILIAINPFKQLRTCSEDAVAEMAARAMQIGDEIKTPHILQVVLAAYHGLCAGESQSILISGESGAGKTESAKLCMSCLAHVSGSEGKSTSAALEAAILLEAFGNASTCYNDNSSRFGRWTEVRLDESYKISTCHIQAFLMERSRVVLRGKGECNYHIFYYLLAGAGAAERETYRLLGDAREYVYLRNSAETGERGGHDGGRGSGGDELRRSSATERLSRNEADAAEWRACVEKLRSLGFSAERRSELFCACSAVLLLGNLRFVPKVAGDADGGVELEGDVEAVAALLQVSPSALSKLLVSRHIFVGSEETGTVVDAPMRLQGCLDMRDALAKAVYAEVFDWCIRTLNANFSEQDAGAPRVSRPDAPNGTSVPNGVHAPAAKGPFLGLLDVFGFENFETNSFEQLCINYTNEKLQAHFIESVIKLVYSDMSREGVACDNLSFPDNADSLQLIEGATGVLALLSDECAVPQGSEAGYVEKLHAAHATHAAYIKPRAPTANRLVFGIQHYAGEVDYLVDNWLDKNRGLVQPELMKLISESGSQALASAFAARGGGAAAGIPAGAGAAGGGGGGGGGRVSHDMADVAPVDGGLGGAVERGLRGRREPQSTGATFRLSLLNLSTRIRSTTEQYVRCIKPNEKKEPGRFVGSLVHRQLRYTGVSAVTELYRAGYPCSLTKSAFIRRYRCLALERSYDRPPQSSPTRALGKFGARSAAPAQLLAGLTEDDACRALLELAPDAPVSPSRRRGHKAGTSFAVTEVKPASKQPALRAGGTGVKEDYLLGITKIFLREQKMRVLERARHAAWRVAVLPLQRYARGRFGVRLRAQLLAVRRAETAVRDAISASEPDPARRALETLKHAMAATILASAQGKVNLKLPNVSELNSQIDMLSLGRTVLSCFPEGACVEVRELECSSEPLPEEGVLDFGGVQFRDMKLMSNVCKGGLGIGVQFNNENKIQTILKIGPALREKKLRVGDLLLKVDGEEVTDTKTAFRNADTGRVHKLTVARVHDDEQDAAEAVGAVGGDGDIVSGYVETVVARGGRAVEMPRKTYAVLRNDVLTTYTDANRSELVDHFPLLEAQCLQPGAAPADAVRSGKPLPEFVETTPATQAFIDALGFPFTLSWPKSTTGRQPDVVFAAASKAERAAWTSAIAEAIHLVNNAFRPGSQRVAGYLMKRSGRKTGKPGKWLKRWFVLQASPADRIDYFKKEAEAAANGRPKGQIALLPAAEAYVPSEGIVPPQAFPFAFSVRTRMHNGSTQTVALAAADAKEQGMWLDALRYCLEENNRRPARNGVI